MALQWQQQEQKKTLYQDCDALFFTEHRCSTQQEAGHNPVDRKPVISAAPWEHKAQTKPVKDSRAASNVGVQTLTFQKTNKKNKQTGSSGLFDGDLSAHMNISGGAVLQRTSGVILVPGAYLCWKLCSRWGRRAERKGRTKDPLDQQCRPPWDGVGEGREKKWEKDGKTWFIMQKIHE